MKLRLVPKLAALLCFLVLPHQAGATSLQTEVAGLYEAELFDELEALGRRFRESKTRTDDGDWELAYYYGGLYAAFNGNHPEPVFWQTHARMIGEWLTKYPESPAAHLMYAQMHIKHARQVGGTVPVDRMKPRNRQWFLYYLSKAREHLVKHKATVSQDPEWYSRMAVIARDEDWPKNDFAALVDEGMRREPRYHQLYYDAVERYLPFWGGTAAEIEAFARKALARTEATEGYAVYALIYWYVDRSPFIDRLSDQTEVDWPTMKKGIDDLVKRFPSDWNINTFASMACWAQDQETTAGLMGRIETPMIPSVWNSGETFRYCRQWSAGS